MKSVLNLNWDSSDPTLFLGQRPGLADFINIAHPKLEELALKQRAQYWIETEVDMKDDKKQWLIIPQDFRDISTENLAWQTMTDTVIARAPEMSIAPLVSRPELEGMIKEWGYFENIHSRAYSNIIQNVMPNPGEFINTIVQNQDAFDRISGTVAAFDNLFKLSAQWIHGSEEDRSVKLKEELQKNILLTYLNFYALESMQFYASFACTFGLAEEDVMLGIANNLKLIAKDEAVHTHMAKEVIKILVKQFPQHVVSEAMEQAPSILRDTLDRELKWAEFIFRDGRKLTKLDKDILSQYLLFIGNTSFSFLGVDMDSEVRGANSNPIMWIDKYLDPNRFFQVAPQEASMTDYKVGQTTTATTDDLDYLKGEFGL